METPVQYHVRSNSLPSRSHPILQELSKKLLFFCEFATKQRPESLVDSLVSVYDSLDDLLHLPLVPEALYRQDRWVCQMLEDSLQWIDVCSRMRDSISCVKEQQLRLLSALRRRDYKGLESLVRAYMSSRKEMGKEFAKCLGPLRKTCRMVSSGSLSQESTQHNEVLEALRQVGSATVFVCESLLSRFISPRTWQSRVSAFFKPKSQLLNCAIVEWDCTKLSLIALYSIASKVDSLCAGDALRQLESLEESMSRIDDRLGCIKSRLIRTRVTLLNILTI